MSDTTEAETSTTVHNMKFYCILILFFLTACRSTKEVQLVETVKVKDSIVYQTKTVTVERRKDSLIKTPADSSWLKALLECDSANQVNLKKILAAKSGNKVKAPSLTIDSNRLTVNCNVDSLEVFMQLYEKLVLNDSSYWRKRQADSLHFVSQVTKPAVSGWQWFQIWVGRILLLLLIAIAIGKFLKHKFNVTWVGLHSQKRRAD